MAKGRSRRRVLPFLDESRAEGEEVRMRKDTRRMCEGTKTQAQQCNRCTASA